MTANPPWCSLPKATCLNEAPFGDACADLEPGCDDSSGRVPANLQQDVRRRVNPFALIAGLLALTLLTLLASCGSENPQGAAETSAETDRQALIAFYEAAGGADWKDNTNWLSDAPLAEWHGVTTGEDGRVVGLHLKKNNLAGELVPELASLSRLVELILHTNQLSGEIPPEFGSFASLKRLGLEHNQLSGEIPPELGNLPSLTEATLTAEQLKNPYDLDPDYSTGIGLSGNRLTGKIPNELGNLEGLMELLLRDNQLEGEIPEELGDLSSLQYIFLHENRLSGEIPADLGNLKYLVTLGLSDNQLSGEIPPELGSIESMTILNLSGNRLEGEIPSELGGLGELFSLEIQDNNLNGEIPEELGALTGLNHLNLSNNRLSGEIPGSLGNLEELETLDLTGNRLTGDFPLELERLTELKELIIVGNRLSGCVPLELERVLNYSYRAVSVRFGDLEFCKSMIGYAEIEEVSHCVSQVNSFGKIEGEWRNNCILTQGKYGGKHAWLYMLPLSSRTSVAVEMLSDEEDYHFRLFKGPRGSAELLVDEKKEIRGEVLLPGRYAVEVASWGTGPFTISISSAQTDR